MRSRFLSQSGFSITDTLVALVLIGVITAGSSALIAGVRTQERATIQKVAATSLRAQLIGVMNNPTLCNSVFANASNTVGGKLTADLSMSPGSPSSTRIDFLKLDYGSTAVAMGTIAVAGSELPGNSGLIIQHIYLDNIISTSSPGQYLTTLTVDWSHKSLAAELAPLKMTQLFSFTGSGTTGQLAGCGPPASSAVAYFVATQELPPGAPSISYNPASGFVPRQLNTPGAYNNLNEASLDPATGIVTLPAGTYYVTAFARGTQVGNHVLRLRNVTTNTDILVGSQAYTKTGTTYVSATNSVIDGTFKLPATQAVQLQHAADGVGNLGIASPFGSNSVVAGVTFRKF